MSSPLDVIENWLNGDGSVMAIPVAASLGIAASESDVHDRLYWWIHRPSNPLETRDMALRLRALVDFECALSGYEDHQTWADENILTGVDSSRLPKEFRVRLNDAIAARQTIRQVLPAAVASWSCIRPDDRSIYEWWRVGISDPQTQEPPAS